MTHPLDPRVTRYLFEGEMLTLRQVHELVPALGVATIRRHLRQGYTNRFQMLNEDPARKKRLNGKRAAKRTNAFTTFRFGRTPVGAKPTSKP